MFANGFADIRGDAVLCAVALLSAANISTPAQAAGDLLVAPTRIILDGRRGAEVTLNNIGNEEATYRISLELRRMNEIGRLEDVDVAAANDTETIALNSISFAPRRVTLPPNQPQSIRIGLRGIETLADGEYRAHMLFRAIPKVAAVTETKEAATGVVIQLIPIYGITIPIIVRKGKLQATATLVNAKLAQDNEGPTLQFELSRNGDRSVFGDVRVNKPGSGEPIMVARGISLYTERDKRLVSLPLNPETAVLMHGPVTIGYYEAPEVGGGLIAQTQVVLP